MANIKLGAIMTDIAGSVGGTTFRRTPSGVIMYNKQGTQIKSAFAKNSVKNKLGVILSSWSSLDNSVKSVWNDLATLYPFKTKFGADKYLTGRQLFTKLNSQLVPVSQSVDVEDFDDRLCDALFDEIVVDYSAEILRLNFDIAIDGFWLLAQFYPVRKNGNAKPSKASFCTVARFVESVDSFNAFTDFVHQYPLAMKNDWFGVNVILMSTSGFQTSVQVKSFELL